MNDTPLKTSEVYFKSFVGLPYSSFNCWGIVVLFYERVFSITLPSLETFLEADMVRHLYHEVASPEFGDIILFRNIASNSHVGIYFNPKQFLHSVEGKNSCIERLAVWEKRVVGYYRYTGIKHE